MLSGTVVVPSSPHQGTGIEKGMVPCEDIGRRFLPGVIGSDVPAHGCLTVGHGGHPRLQSVQQCRRLPPRGQVWPYRRIHRYCRGHSSRQSHSRRPTRLVTRIITTVSVPVTRSQQPLSTPWRKPLHSSTTLEIMGTRREKAQIIVFI